MTIDDGHGKQLTLPFSGCSTNFGNSNVEKCNKRPLLIIWCMRRKDTCCLLLSFVLPLLHRRPLLLGYMLRRIHFFFCTGLQWQNNLTLKQEIDVSILKEVTWTF